MKVCSWSPVSSRAPLLRVQGDLHKKWSDMKIREDKIVLSKHETLKLVVEQLGGEVMNQKEKEAASSASTGERR